MGRVFIELEDEQASRTFQLLLDKLGSEEQEHEWWHKEYNRVTLAIEETRADRDSAITSAGESQTHILNLEETLSTREGTINRLLEDLQNEQQKASNLLSSCKVLAQVAWDRVPLGQMSDHEGLVRSFCPKGPGCTENIDQRTDRGRRKESVDAMEKDCVLMAKMVHDLAKNEGGGLNQFGQQARKMLSEYLAIGHDEEISEDPATWTAEEILKREA